MDKAYLKCNYYNGMFSTEYFINFRGSEGRGIAGNLIIMKDKIVLKNESSGLVPILIAKKENDFSNILIDGSMDVGAGEFFKVPNEDIVRF